MARYNFTVSHIRNSWIRRSFMLITFIPLVAMNILFISVGMTFNGLKHLFQNMNILIKSFKQHW